MADETQKKPVSAKLPSSAPSVAPEVKPPSKPVQKPAPNLHVLLGTDAVKAREAASQKNSIALKRGILKKVKLRHAIIAATFALFVAVPSVVTSIYMAFIAADQYHSSTSFSVRSISSSGSNSLLGIFTQASSSTTADSYILIDYIRSEQMLKEVEQNFDIESVFARRGSDFFYAMKSGLPVEKRLEYWRKMISITFDHASGIMKFEIRAFNPDDAQRLAAFVAERSEKLINELSDKAREEVLRDSQSEVAVAEKRLAEARKGVRQYRDATQEVDPVAGAELAAKLIGGLETRLLELNTTLAAAKTQMTEESPRIKVMKAEIKSLKDQLALERQRLGSGGTSEDGAPLNGGGDVAGRIQEYQSLEVEQEFAEKAYTAAMAGLEKARIEASSKELYLATFIQPTLSQMAQYPGRLLNSLLVTLAALFAWAIGVMVYYNIRDRA